MKKLLLILTVLCFSLVCYGQFTGNAHCTTDTIASGQLDTVYFLDYAGNTNPACVLYWECNGVQIPNTVGIDSLFVAPLTTTTYTVWYLNDVMQTLKSDITIHVINVSIQELQQTSNHCYIYDMKGSLVYNGKPIRKKGLFIYKYQLNDKYYIRKIYTL